MKDNNLTVDPELEQDWWKDTNELCEQCKNDCKQSSKVKMERCPQYEQDKENS